MKREWIAALVLVCLCGGVFAQGEPEALDIDSNGGVDALTDGLLALRYMFGFHGAALTAGAVANDCGRCDPDEIERYLNQLLPRLDVDGNGEVDALTDGLLILRYLFGFRGATLTTAAVAPDCTRCDAGSIETWLEELIPTAPDPPSWVDTGSREASRAFHREEYLGSAVVDSGWTGNHASCDAGTTSEAFRTAVLRRINYFRSMAGIPSLAGLNASYNAKAQAAALMMSVNGALSHNPNSSWTCFTTEGHEGAGSSNLYLGVYGPAAISGYIRDPGAGNHPVGHRRWILYPQTRHMGTGDIPPTAYWAANALWVFDLDNIWAPRPETRDGFVAWPPPGYAPYQVVYPRWSFSFPQADFSVATVSMTRAGETLPLQLNPPVYGYGENTLVWEPQASFGIPPGGDTSYHVTVSDVLIGGQPHIFAYTVVIFDPE